MTTAVEVDGLLLYEISAHYSLTDAISAVSKEDFVANPINRCRAAPSPRHFPTTTTPIDLHLCITPSYHFLASGKSLGFLIPHWAQILYGERSSYWEGRRVGICWSSR